MRDTFINTLIEIAKYDRNVHLITGDLGYGALKPFWEQLPSQFTNAGIAEQNMTSFAAGMALQGKIVFTYSIGNFSTLRVVEQIRNDCAYHKANVKIISIGGGFSYGPHGMSHHATEDIAVMRSLPEVTVFAPGDLTEVEYATRAIYDTQGTCYLRLGKGGEKRIHTELNDFQIGKAIKLKGGEHIVIFSTGGILEEVIESSVSLGDAGISPGMYSFPTVKPIDRDTIEYCAYKYDYIVTVEEHNVLGGFGSSISEVLAELPGSKATLLKIGVNDIYTSTVGTQQYLREVNGLDANSITKKINNVNRWLK